MITDITLAAWSRWLTYSSRNDTTISVLPIHLRDSEQVKTYPGIYLEETSSERIEAGDVADGNSFRVEIETKLVTTPGDNDQVATSAAEHDILRRALDPHIQSCQAEGWIDSQIGIVCHQILSGQPVTTEANGYRVTTWKCEFVMIEC